MNYDNTVKFDNNTAGRPQTVSTGTAVKQIPDGEAIRADIPEDGLQDNFTEIPGLMDNKYTDTDNLPKLPEKPLTKQEDKQYNNVNASNIILLVAIYLIYKLR